MAESIVLKLLRYRPALSTGAAMFLIVLLAELRVTRPVTAALIGWDCGILAYALVLSAVIWRSSVDRLRTVAATLDEGRWTLLMITLAASIASLGAIVAELARVHGTPHAGWTGILSGITVLLSWFFIHTMFATHYAHEFWRDGGLSFPGNDRPGYGEFLYFSFCMAVASQVSDVSTQSAGMRRLVLVHSLVAYLFNTAIIALGVNIAASLAS